MRDNSLEKDFTSGLGLVPYNLQGPSNDPPPKKSKQPRRPRRQAGPKPQAREPRRRPGYVTREMGVPNNSLQGDYLVTKAPTGVMVAVWVPPEVAAKLALPSGIKSDDMHMTVCFLGESFMLDPQQTAAIIPTVWEVAKKFGPISATISGLGRFESVAKGTDVVYASVDAPQLPQLYTALCSALAANGVAPSLVHGLSPHVSLKYLEPGEKLPSERITQPWFIDHLTVAIGTQRVDIPLADQHPLRDVLVKNAFDEYQSLSGLVNSLVVNGQMDQRDGSMLLHRYRDGRMNHEQIISYITGLVAGHDDRQGHWVSVSNGKRTLFLYANGHGTITKGPEPILGTSIYDLRPIKGVWSVHHLASGKEPPKGALKEIVDLHASLPLEGPNTMRPTRGSAVLHAALLTLFNLPDLEPQAKAQ